MSSPGGDDQGYARARSTLIPSFLVLLTLALAAWRTWRLLALDTILTGPRDWLVGYGWEREEGEDQSVTEEGWTVENHFVIDSLRTERPRLAEWLVCPYCSGFWVALAWYGAWLAWPKGSLYAAVPAALSAAVAIIQTVLPE